jgi:hypothetical protein
MLVLLFRVFKDLRMIRKCRSMSLLHWKLWEYTPRSCNYIGRTALHDVSLHKTILVSCILLYPITLFSVLVLFFFFVLLFSILLYFILFPSIMFYFLMWFKSCCNNFLFYYCCSQLEHKASVKRFVSLQFLNLRQSVGLLGWGSASRKAAT